MRNLVDFTTKHTIWSNAIIFLILVFGLFSVFNIKKSFFPEVDPNLVLVQVTYPGASPKEMEEGIILKVEQALRGIQGIEEMTSTASENLAMITIEVDGDYDADLLLTEVKNAVDQINAFPENAEKPRVYKQKPRGEVIDMVLVGDVDMMSLKRYADGVRDDLLASGLISQVEISGFPNREISIEVTEETLIRYGLTFDQLGNAIRLNNRDISSGSVKAPDEEVLIRSRAKKYSGEGIGNIIIRTNEDGSILRLNDIASPIEQFEDVPNKSLYNGKPAATLRVSKFQEDDILEIRDYVFSYTDNFNGANSAVTIILDNDRSAYLLARLNILLSSGMVGLLLVLVFLGFFLNLRLSFWVAFGIPFSFLGMFIIATLMGITINIMSLFGMIMVIGILVDDGIVVGENIYAHFEKGKSALKAAVDGTLEVLPAVFTGVTTTMLAFSLFFFLEGRTGQFVREMAIVVILCLAFSLVECTLILAPHIAHSGALFKSKPSKFRKWFDKHFFYVRDRMYGTLLRQVIKHRYITLSVTVAIVLVIMGMVQGQYLRMTFFPSFSRSDNISIGLVLKPGTREYKTEALLKNIEQKVLAYGEERAKDRPDGRNLIMSTRLDLGRTTAESGGHVGTLRVELLPEEIRKTNKMAEVGKMRRAIGPVPEAEQLTLGEGRRFFGKPVSVSLKSRNLVELEAAKEAVKNAVSNHPDLKDVTDSNIPGKREINIQLKPQAYVLGLTHNDITRQIRQGFFGEEVQRLQIGQDEVRVWLRYPEENRKSLGELEQIKIKTTAGQEFPLTDLVEYETVRGVVNIKHLNGARESRVEADLADAELAAQPILAELQSTLVPQLRAQYPGVSVSFEGQARQSNRFGASFMNAFPILLFGILVLIALTFRSFSQALLIFPMIGTGILGAFIGHWIEGKPVSILSFYGVVALTGVIVNDAVVFGDKFNRLLKGGHTLASALFFSGKSRFRPIILTSLTTVVGLFPLIRDTSSTAQFLIPMAISVAYGVFFGTLFILTTYPALIAISSDIRVGVVWLWNFLWNADSTIPSRTSVEPIIQGEKKVQNIL